MKKFQRNYRAEFEIGIHNKNQNYIPQEKITIEYPLTCNLNIDVGSYSSASNGTFQFYNLSKQDQAKLWLDEYEIGKKYVSIKFYAGYGNTMPLIFQGDLQRCISYRESGAVDWITELTAFQGGNIYRYGYCNDTFVKGTDLKDILNYFSQNFKDLKPGYITPEIPPLSRNRTFIGQTMDILGREYGGYEIFIDKGELNILGDNDVIPGEIQVITDKTGLLGSPKRANLFVKCDMLFEPQLRTGQAVILLSDSMPQFNQAYKIVDIKHNGIISPRVSGTLITTCTLSLFPDNNKPNELKKTSTPSFGEEPTTGIWGKPVQGRITGSYGEQRKSHPHKGLDIGTIMNSPVYAPASGMVFMANWYGGYGKCIQIDNGTINGKKVSSLYGHLNQWLVAPKQNVYKGQLIGYVGSTGNSDGPHLHFEVRENGIPVNPTKYIGNY